ncbi:MULTISPECIES: hypothetical protein [Burkholderia]|uniref:hypothetical protein n=1 Tax=Burkholderia TaxID=32008 RepID=UPI000AC6BE3F|nr:MULTISPECIES: hypothetical protein [Burkholderia]
MIDLILEWPTYILSGTMPPDALAAARKRASDPIVARRLEMCSRQKSPQLRGLRAF